MNEAADRRRRRVRMVGCMVVESRDQESLFMPYAPSERSKLLRILFTVAAYRHREI